MSDYENNKKYCNPIREVLSAMEKGLDGMSKDGDEDFYDCDFYFGFGKMPNVKMAKMYVCPESYEIMEIALSNLLTFVNEEYPADRVQRENGEVFYYSWDDRKYLVVEAFTPGGTATHDIGILMEEVVDEDGIPTYKPLNEYVAGISEMTDNEILEWAREAIEKDAGKNS